MSVIDTLIFDRTLQDVERVKTLARKGYANMTTLEKAAWNAGLKGAYNNSDANRVANACTYLYNKITTDYDYTITAWVVPRSDWNVTDIPTNNSYASYVYSCLYAFANSSIPQYIKDKFGDIPAISDARLDYLLVNQMEKYLYDINYYTECVVTTNISSVSYNKAQANTDIMQIVPSGSTQITVKGCVRVNCEVNDDNVTKLDLEDGNVNNLSVNSTGITTLKISPATNITGLVCPNLTRLYIYKNATLAAGALNRCPNLQYLTIEEGSSFRNETGVIINSDNEITGIYGNEVIIPTDSDILNINMYAMNYLRNVTLIIPNNIQFINSYAFANASNLEHVVVGAGLSSIAANSFASDNKILDFIVNTNNPNFKSENNAMLNKAGTTLVFGGANTTAVPSGVTTINERAFASRNMNSLTLDIPVSVTSFGNYAFVDTRSYNGQNMTFNYAGTMAQWNAITKGTYWKYNSSYTKAHCTDGDITL